MDVSIVNLQTLFAKPMRYEIPLFQRPYVWNHEEQWVRSGKTCRTQQSTTWMPMG